MTQHDISIEDTFGKTGLLSKKLPGYRERPQQIELAERIHQAFQLGTTLIAEAPTGVGKSLAALVPAFQAIQQNDARVLVVTSSILLQGQYIEKDIPFLQDLYKLDTKPVLIKGKSNYVCLRKLNSHADASVVEPRNGGQWQRINEWAQTTETGDFRELDFRPAPDVRRATAIVQQHECKKRSCAFAKNCFYYMNKKKLTDAKLVVCNYHYLFTALTEQGFDQMFGGAFDYVVYDEAHEILNIARDYMERRVSRRSLDTAYGHLNNTASAVNVNQNDYNGCFKFLDQLDYSSFMNNVNNIYDAAFRSFISRKEPHERTMIYDNQKFISGSLTDLSGHFHKLHNDFDRLARENIPDEEMRTYMTDEERAWCLAVEDFGESIRAARQTIDMMLAEEEGYITWVELANRATKDDDMVYILKPHDVSNLLDDMFSQFEASVCMSATMLVGDSLDYFADQLGITGSVRDDLVVETPFDLAQNLLWYLPQDCPEGGAPDHADFAIKEMHQVASYLKGRTLCLFTSYKNMKAAQVYFDQHPIKGVKVMSQERYQKERIVWTMRSSKSIVVLATKSFFTGVDIQGDYLSAVLIDKIPFPMVGDPINDYLSSMRRGFQRFLLPEAIITLKQAVGRLNRTEDDRGVVAVFDGRLSSKNYKHKIFRSFRHKIRGVRSIEDVQAFFEEVPS